LQFFLLDFNKISFVTVFNSNGVEDEFAVVVDEVDEVLSDNDGKLILDVAI
jgi:hypothetical protein